MRNSLKMVIISVSLLWFIKISAEVDDCKEEARCSHHGPAIRFPFWLKDRQPDHCGYPQFELSCTDKNQTTIHLSHSMKLLVKKINYKSQKIHVHEPDHCSLEQLLNLSLSAASPFRFQEEDPEEDPEDYCLFNCSSPKRDSYDFRPVPCLSVPDYTVYAVTSRDLARYLDLSSCLMIQNVSLPYKLLDPLSSASMNWAKPMCRKCEIQGKRCRLRKGNSTEPETECIKIPEQASPKKQVMITGVTLGSILFMLVVFALYRDYSLDKLERDNQIEIENFLEEYMALKPTRYSYVDIKRITNHFKDKLGEGGYGIVYKGKLSDEVLVAVKILNNFKGNGEEFINEVRAMIKIHHVNIVRLVGFCADGLRRALVYEFLPNGSLEKFIFSTAIKKCSLGWEKLQDIALGIAKGIEYLHQGCDQRIVHFDIKPHNILLDHNFNPKISDFGLAKLYSKEESVVSMNAARGTMGYIAPEVLSRNLGNVSFKSDVYSFGMLLLEIVGGRKNIDVTVKNTSQVYFPEWIYDRLNKGEELHIRIEEDEDAKIAKKLTIVGLWCIQWYPVNRPTMKLVVQMLEQEGGDNLAMPPNPFTNMNPMRTNAN